MTNKEIFKKAKYKHLKKQVGGKHYKKIKKPDSLNNNYDNRAKLIEEAALRLIHSKDNKKNTEKDIEFLKQALIWEKKNG